MLDWIFFALAGCCLFSAASWAVAMAFADDNLRLAERPPGDPAEPPGGWPRLALIVPARNEEEGLPAALASLEALDYPALEIILIDDGSADRTGELMRAFAEKLPGRVRLIENPELPPGWMGKNNAVWRAANLAESCEWLLFTDADIVFEPDSVRRAVALAEGERADILPALPRLVVAGFWEKALLPFVCAVGLAVCMLRASKNPGRKHAMGVGAFTLVRRGPYFEAGGHKAIANQPVEDVWLARLMKAKGFRYAIANGAGLVRVRMYSSLGAIFSGFRKNSWAATDERLWMALGGAATQLLNCAAPAAALAGGIAGWALGADPSNAWAALAVAGALSWGASAWLASRRARALVDVAPAWLLFFPVAGAVAALIVLASTWDGAVGRKIRWRGRELPLDAPPPGNE